jgi:RNA polymerase sigma-70 factor (sigma-E family)
MPVAAGRLCVSRGKRIGGLLRRGGVGERRSAEFEEFYDANRDACLRAVLASTADHRVAEDLVAEAFARAWMRWSRVRRHPAPRAWVVRTALNAGISRWRKQRREQPLADEDIAAAEAGSHKVDASLLAALRRLPQRQREVVALRVFLDLDIAETARTLGIAPGTVTAHLSRAIAALRHDLDPAKASLMTPRPTSTR